MSENFSDVLSPEAASFDTPLDPFERTSTVSKSRGMRVVVGACSPALLSGLQTLLASTPGVSLQDCANCREQLISVCSASGACVVLVDAALCPADAREFITRLRVTAPRTQVVLISDDSHPHLVREAIKGGACGFVTKAADIDEICDALVAASTGHRYISSSMMADLAECLTLQDLTSREMEVLKILARGECNKVIARELDVTVGTIKTHVRSIMLKLDSRGRTDVLLKAHRLGLVRIA
jgi:two-component system NarL family response regulator